MSICILVLINIVLSVHGLADSHLDAFCYSHNDSHFDDAAILSPGTGNSFKIRVGDILPVNCRAHPKLNVNINELRFRRVTSAGSVQLLESTIVDNKTIQTTLEGIEASEFCLVCGTRNQRLRSQMVAVGYPPLDVKNVVCISYNWETLVCSFDLPANPVQNVNEDFVLSYSIIRRRNITTGGRRGGRREKLLKTHFGYQCASSASHCCYRTKQTGQRCWQWNSSEKHFFEKFFPLFQLTVSSTNQLGRRSYAYEINQYERMIPNPAEDLRVKAESEFSIIVDFKLPRFLKSFPPGLIYRVLYETSFDERRVYLNRTTNETRVTVDLVDVWPGQQYSITVQLKSGANDLREEIWWSLPKTVDIRTWSTVPLHSPESHPKFFQSLLVRRRSDQTRDVVVYWTPLDEKYKGGGQFHYEVQLFQRYSGLQLSIRNTTDTFINYEDLSTNVDYKIVITSANMDGKSRNSSTVLITKDSSIDNKWHAPIFIYSHRDNFVQLTWYNQSLWREDNFTLLWCLESEFDQLQNLCKNILGWKDLEWKQKLNFTSHTLGTELSVEILRFGIVEMSAGIIWCSCETSDSEQIFDSVAAPQFQLHSYSNISTVISVSWELNCLQWSRLPLSITVFWCRETNGGDISSHRYEVWHRHIDIENLKENTNYRFWLRIDYISGSWSIGESRLIWTSKPALSTGSMFLITSLSLAVAIFLTVTLIYTRRKLIEFWRQCTSEIPLPKGLLSDRIMDEKEMVGGKTSECGLFLEDTLAYKFNSTVHTNSLLLGINQMERNSPSHVIQNEPSIKGSVNEEDGKKSETTHFTGDPLNDKSKKIASAGYVLVTDEAFRNDIRDLPSPSPSSTNYARILDEGSSRSHSKGRGSETIKNRTDSRPILSEGYVTAFHNQKYFVRKPS